MDDDGEVDIVLDNSMGLIDFAGGGVVHVTGGGAALVAATIIGPRYGRFDSDGVPKALPGQSVALSSLGVFILWFGWYGFNPGSTQAFYQNMYVASKCAVATTLAAASGGITVQAMHIQSGNKPDLSPSLNGESAEWDTFIFWSQKTLNSIQTTKSWTLGLGNVGNCRVLVHHGGH